jgi:iron-sulfur cluster repair protein YtfE (RIC family)
LDELGDLLERLKKIHSFETMGLDLEKLRDISHHLVEAESHHQREEDVLFPELEKHEIVEPGATMKMDHVEFRKRKQGLYVSSN